MKLFLSGHAKLTQATFLILFIALVYGCTSLKRYAYEGFNRDSWQKPEQVIGALEVQHGHHIADIGAGSGYFTFRLSELVGPSGKVYAVDVDAGMIDYLKQRSLEAGYSNVVTVLAERQDPLLPENGIDLIFLCNTYHHLEDREQYFKHAAKYLSENGRVAIIDLVGKGWIEKVSGHWIAKDVIQGEMEASGFRLQQEHEFLPRQSFLIFTLAGP